MSRLLVPVRLWLNVKGVSWNLLDSSNTAASVLLLPSVARLQRLVMSQGMVAHNPTGAGETAAYTRP